MAETTDPPVSVARGRGSGLGPAATHVSLEVPGGTDYAPVACLVAADVAERAGFTLREIEDLGLAIDEIHFSLAGSGGAGRRLALLFEGWPGVVCVSATNDDDGGAHAPEAGPLAATRRQILDAVVDEYEFARLRTSTFCWAIKRRGARVRSGPG